MSLAGKKLGIMLSAKPGTLAFAHALGLATQALQEGVQVYFYCIDSAVEGLSDHRFTQLKANGLRWFACAYSLHQRGLPPQDGATLAGLSVLSDVIASTDRFVSFNQ